jgi:DNA replication licensing factor MCM4
LNARTAILAAANPKQSKYDPKLSVVENVALPPTLLSRFEMIYLIFDKQSDASDRRLANTIVSLYSVASTNVNTMSDQSTSLIATNHITREFLAKSISYARMKCNPKIPERNSTSLSVSNKRCAAWAIKYTITPPLANSKV